MTHHKSRSIGVLESPHAMALIMYVYDNEGCQKSSVYADVSHNTTMARKIDALEREGILTQVPMARGKALYLTDTGKAIAVHLKEIQELCDDSRRMQAAEGFPADPRRMRA